MQRAWMFGPRRVGPNILLAAHPSTCTAEAEACSRVVSSATTQSSGPGSLFQVPPVLLSRLTKHAQHGRALVHGLSGRGEVNVDGEVDDEGEQQVQQVRDRPSNLPVPVHDSVVI